MKISLGIAGLTSTLTLGLAGGCGTIVEVEGFGGGGSSTSSGTGGDGGGGSSSSSTSGTGGSGAQDVCSGFDDEQGGSAVTVRLRNESGLPIYLPAHCGVLLYDLVAVPADDVHYAFDPFCLQTCADLRTQGIIDCADCPPTSILLPPGATHDVVWDRTGLANVVMPDSCWHQPGQQGPACPQIVAAEAGTYQIFAMGYESCTDGSCQCDESGACDGAGTGMEAYSDPETFVLGGGTSLVEAVFGACAFPCPSG